MSPQKSRMAQVGEPRPSAEQHNTLSLADATPNGTDHTAQVAGVYVAVVQVRGDRLPHRYRRRTYWNLPSAQRAIDRAHMAGLDASVVLCQLVPVDGGGQLG